MTQPAARPGQQLRAHLDGVAGIVANAGGSETAQAIGWWHDVGKAADEWQTYLTRSAAGESVRSPGHARESAAAFFNAHGGSSEGRHAGLAVLSGLIAGHHGGIPNMFGADGWVPTTLGVSGGRIPDRATQAELDRFDRRVIDASNWATASTPPTHTLELPASADEEMRLRLMFSMLIDADNTDAARTLAAATEDDRTLADLLPAWHSRQPLVPVTEWNKAQNAVFDEVTRNVLTNAGSVLTLTAPTGIGKTRCVLGASFALAADGRCDRLVIAVPYVQLADLVAEAISQILGTPIRPDGTRLIHPDVLVHHHVFDADDRMGGTASENWQRTLETWNKPIIVTTHVQLLESLHSNRRRPAAKLHRLRNSLIVIDEIQQVPHHLQPATSDTLRMLASDWAAIVILSTATQPTQPGTSRELFADSRLRTEVTDMAAGRYRWDIRINRRLMIDELAGAITATADHAHQVLAIVNSTRAAADLFHHLHDQPVAGARIVHLSARMCQTHRSHVLAGVRRSLDTGERLIVVATQVMESGVDVDFPVVMRQLAPLEAIIQAAGRANRRAGTTPGTVIVFDLHDSGPPGWYRTCTDAARTVLHHNPTRPPEALWDRYLHERDARSQTDPNFQTIGHLDAARRNLRFRDIANLYRMIESQATVVVPYNGAPSTAGDAWTKERLRQIAPFTVNIHHTEAERGVNAGSLTMLDGTDMYLATTETYGVCGLTRQTPK